MLGGWGGGVSIRGSGLELLKLAWGLQPRKWSSADKVAISSCAALLPFTLNPKP